MNVSVGWNERAWKKWELLSKFKSCESYTLKYPYSAIFWFSVFWTSGQCLPGWDKQWVAERIFEQLSLSETCRIFLGLLTVDPSKFIPCLAMGITTAAPSRYVISNFFWKFLPSWIQKWIMSTSSCFSLGLASAVNPSRLAGSQLDVQSLV